MATPAKKDPLQMTLAELLREYGGGTKKASGTFPKAAQEEPLPTPPAPRTDFHARTFVNSGKRFIRITDLAYNHRFVRGFIPYRVAKEGHMWQWDRETKSWVIPLEDAQLLAEGLKECFKATSLTIDGKQVKL